MAKTGKFTTIYDIIERVRRDGIEDFSETDAVEWAYEAISLMGEVSHLVDKVAMLPVEHARAALPFDLCDMTEGGVRDYKTKYQLRQNNDIFYNPDTVGGGLTPVIFETVGESIVYIDGVPQENTDVFLDLKSYTVGDGESYTYKVNDGFIFTGFKTGTIELAYKAFPVDSNYNPMIEDDIKVVRAVVSYIKRKVAYRMYMRDEISAQKYAEIKKESMFHTSSSRSNSAIGSVDDWGSMMERVKRLRRDDNLHKVGFKNYSLGESLNI